MKKIGVHIRILKTLGISVLCVLTLETCARIDDWIKWDANFFTAYAAELLSVVDDNGYHSKPNAKYQKWSINSFGFRSKEITKEKPEDIIRIVTIGASETFGLYESENMEFPAQLQTILDEKEPHKYQVLNAAHAGMSIPRIIEYYKSWLQQFDADVIIYYPSPVFYLDNLPPRYRKLSPIKQNNFTNNFRLWDRSKIIVKKFFPKEMQAYLKEYFLNKEIAKQPSDWVFESVPVERVQIFEEHLLELIKEISMGDTKLILSTHINRLSKSLTEVDKQFLVNTRTIYTRASVKSIIELDVSCNSVIRKIESSDYVEIVELDKLVTCKPEYFADLAHFTDSGAYVVAEVLARKLIEMQKNEL